jgi:hypothetical protein
VVKQGTPWWVPIVAALLVAAFAAAASYYATWRFKRADFDRENAVRAAEELDEADRVLSLARRSRDEGDIADALYQFLQRARIRAEPLYDADLEDRVEVAIYLVSQPMLVGGFRGERLLARAIADARAGLLPHLSRPGLWPRRRNPVGRTFPTSSELIAMHDIERDDEGFLIYQDDEGLMDQIDEWQKRAKPSQ